MRLFPTVEALAEADLDDVLAAWSGLGYYRRARNLHSGAIWIVQNGFPTTANEWLNVPGVGRYTAGAIASIAMGERVALVDGNVERVFSRIQDFAFPNPKLHKATWEWAETNLPASRAGDWNQALMELGATLCTPKNPKCSECPLASHCLSFSAGSQSLRPVKSEKTKYVQVVRHALVIEREDKFALVRIPEGEWWGGMWMFPTLDQAPEGERISSVKHTVTHHKLTYELWLSQDLIEGAKYFSLEEMDTLPIPGIQRKMMNALLKSIREQSQENLFDL